MSNRPIIKNYRKGVASYDGNPMVGGRWWGCQHLGYADIPLERILAVVADDDYDDVYRKLSEAVGESVRVEAYLDEGADESVGLPYTATIDEVFDPDEAVINAIYALPLTQRYCDGIVIELYRIIENELNEEDFTLYDAD